MNPNALRDQCIRTIQKQAHTDKPTIAVVLPKGWKAPKGFPRRTLLCVNAYGESVFSLRADRLLKWLESNGV